jgi:hypothetical protein
MVAAPETDDVELFRGMRVDVDGRPLVAESARGLGARNPIDIELDGDERVRPGVGGMSVSPDSPANLPRHRRPPSWGGTGLDDVWAISVSELGEKLTYRPDPDQPETHGFIEPGETMTLADYQAALTGTRPRWRQVPGVIEKSQ